MNGVRAMPGAIRASIAAAVLGTLGASGAMADAGALSSVTVGRVRVAGNGAHQAWVTAVDDLGRPIVGLGEAAFEVREDSEPVERLEVEPWPDLYQRLQVTVVVDAELFEAGSRRGLMRVVRALGEAAGRRGHLRVVAAGARGRSLEADASNAEDLAARLHELDRGEDAARLYDALFSEISAISRLPAGTGRAVVVITRGADAGSRQGVLEILAIAGEREQPTPVLVALIAETRGAPEAERLTRLGIRSGGASIRVRSIEELEAATVRLLERIRGSYRLSFHPMNWNRKLDRHELRVAVSQEGQVRSGVGTFETADVVAVPGWKRPTPWLWLGAILAAGALALLALRRRPVFVLLVENGDEEGYRYVVYATPLTLGAAEGNDVTFHEPRLSRNHSVLDRRGSSIEITDLNSENGTFVNGERVTRRSLADGDQISLGQAVELTFETKP